MTTIKIVVLIVALLICAICGIASMLKSQQMVNDVNSKLPDDQKFSPIGWYYAKHRRLLTEYRRLYPDGRLIHELRTLSFGVWLLPLVGSAVLGFGVLGALFFGVGGGLLIWFTYKA
jgi:hypothetical protein